MILSCPTCNILLDAQTIDEIRLWKCASCSGFTISLPLVRKGVKPEIYKAIWQKLSSGESRTGRPCPGCRYPLNEVEAEGQGGVILIDVCRTCHMIWFDDNEFSELPKVEKRQELKSENGLLTREDRAFAAFKEEQYRRRSFLFKILDKDVTKELGLDDLLGGFFR